MYQKRFYGRASCISNTFKSKKAQVTIFIILGMVLLLILALGIVFRKEIISFKPDFIVPTQKGKVEQFITECIQTEGEKAVLTLGLQGGYITVPEAIRSDAALHLQTSPFTVIPYWAYGLNTNIPSLEFIKQEIDHYLEENVPKCLFENQAFQESYDLVEKSPIQADTKIGEEKIAFDVHWEVQVRNKLGEVIADLTDHTADSNIKLKHVYETAKLIVDKEMNSLKLEDITQDLIALEHPNVPVAGFEISCQQKKWKIDTVKETFQDMLRVNIRELKASGTNYVEFPEELPYYQNHYIFDLGEDFHQPDVSVLFQYENNYPFSFEVTPRSGSYLRSNQLGGNTELLSAFCMQSWKFVYDVSYPVQVTVKDLTTDYDFKMAFTVHVQRNYPNRNEPVGNQKTFFFSAVSDEDYCSQARVPMTVYTYSLIEDPASGVYVRDPLDNAQISFSCLKYSCELGKTEYNFGSIGDAAAYRTVFPYCVGGILRAQKDGYKEQWKRAVTAPNAETELDLAPLISIPAAKIKILKHTLKDGEIGAAQPLDADETALITISNWKNNESEPFHKSTMLISPKMDPKVQEQEKLDFLAGTDFPYHLEIDILNQDTIVGGYRGNWTVSWDELQKAQEIDLHAISTENPTEEQQFELILGLEEQSASLPKPVIQ